MSAVVLDASSALTWCFEDEAAQGSDDLFTQVQQAGAVVPPLWHLEIASLLDLGEKVVASLGCFVLETPGKGTRGV